MGRAPCCSGEHAGLKKGPWSHEEDEKLRSFVLENPNTSWRLVPPKAGLLRCGKSCRLRWMNYLRPDIKRGNFTPEEEKLIVQLHAAVGNKWAVIASQLPGRTDNEIKNLWNTKLRKFLVLKGINPITHQPLCSPFFSDFVKQWIKSFENLIISGLVSQSSTVNTSISTTTDINDNHIPLDAFLSPLVSFDRPSSAEASYQPCAFDGRSRNSSWAAASSHSNEGSLIDDFLWGDVSLPNNLSDYLKDDVGNSASGPLSGDTASVDMDSMTSTAPVNLEEEFKLWS
ncbi:hypothetical protein ACLOJK_009113 [Asimina triloba]